MVLEAAGGLASGGVPQAERLVPRPGEGEVAVGGEHENCDSETEKFKEIISIKLVMSSPYEPNFSSFYFCSTL